MRLPLSSTSPTWYTAASRLLRARKAMLFCTAYTKEGTLNFISSLGLPKTFSLKDALNLPRLPVSLWKQKGEMRRDEEENERSSFLLDTVTHRIATLCYVHWYLFLEFLTDFRFIKRSKPAMHPHKRKTTTIFIWENMTIRFTTLTLWSKFQGLLSILNNESTRKPELPILPIKN